MIKDDEGQEYLLLSRFNTDPAENLFSMLRMNRGSYDREPSPYLFMINLKQIMFLELKLHNRSGYEVSNAETLLKDVDISEMRRIDAENISSNTDDELEFTDSLPENMVSARFTRRNKTADDDDFDNDNDIESSPKSHDVAIFLERSCSEKLLECAAAFYAGFCVYKLEKLMGCETCIVYMKSNDEEDIRHTLIKMRAYKSSRGLKYHEILKAPSREFIKEFRNIHDKFEEIFPKVQSEKHVVDIVIKEIVRVLNPLSELQCRADHKEQIVLFIVKGLIRTTLKNINDTLK